MARDKITQTCSLTHCNLPHRANGYCNTHNQRVLAHGDKADLLKPIRHLIRKVKYVGCKVENCLADHCALGYCQIHYDKLYVHGIADFVAPKGHSANPWHIEDEGFSDFFYSKVDKTPGLGRDGDCWEWRGASSESLYGFIVIDKRPHKVHRIAWAIANGRFPRENLFVLHSCDNPPCCNPDHLREGTHEQNMQDMIDRGRSKAFRGQLKVEQVKAIKLELQKGRLIRDIATDFQVSRLVVSNIRTGYTWKKVLI